MERDKKKTVIEIQIKILENRIYFRPVRRSPSTVGLDFSCRFRFEISYASPYFFEIANFDILCVIGLVGGGERFDFVIDVYACTDVRLDGRMCRFHKWLGGRRIVFLNDPGPATEILTAATCGKDFWNGNGP